LLEHERVIACRKATSGADSSLSCGGTHSHREVVGLDRGRFRELRGC
jgi:hypothetical protein